MRRSSLVAALAVLTIIIVASFLFFGPSSSPPSSSTTTTSTVSVIKPSTTTSTTAPVSAINGTGYISTTVSEPGKFMCPPGYACVPRSLTLDIYYPSTVSSTVPVLDGNLAYPQNGQYPLVVFGIGFDMMPANYLPLITAWVNAGYVVAAPIFPLTSASGLSHYGVDLTNSSLADRYEDDLVNEPGDMAASISAVAGLDASKSSLLYNSVNTSDVAAAGQSDGGDATLALTYNKCCEYTPIKAAMVFSGAEFPGFNGAYFASSPTPMLVTQGSADTVNLPSSSQTIYTSAPPPKYYLNLVGADHLQPYTAYNAYEQAVAAVSIDFLNGYLKGQNQALAAMSSSGNVAGTAQFNSVP